MKELNAQLTALSPRQRTLLEVWLKSRQCTHPAPECPVIPRRIRKDSSLLSFPQQRLWFMEQLEPGSVRYNLSHTVRLTGELNIPALQYALDKLVERHDVLRTTYVAIEGIPQQRVA